MATAKVARNRDEVVFITAVPDVDNASIRGIDLERTLRTGTATRKLAEVKKDWNTAVEQIVEILSATGEKTPPGYNMGDVQFSLGFDARGLLGLATVGVQASVTITFNPKQGAQT